jgi:hypothetical protein
LGWGEGPGFWVRVVKSGAPGGHPRRAARARAAWPRRARRAAAATCTARAGNGGGGKVGPAAMVLQLQGQWAQEWAHAQAQLTRAQELTRAPPGKRRKGYSRGAEGALEGGGRGTRGGTVRVRLAPALGTASRRPAAAPTRVGGPWVSCAGGCSSAAWCLRAAAAPVREGRRAPLWGEVQGTARGCADTRAG